MTEATLRTASPIAPVALAWRRISPSLVPILAVLTALIITIPFMIATGARGDFSRGLGIVGTAYSALIEGSIGIAINDQLDRGDLDQVLPFADSADLSERGLRRLAQSAAAYATLGTNTAERYADILPLLGEVNDQTLADLSLNIGALQTLGAEALDALRPLVAELLEAQRSAVRSLGEQVRGSDTLSQALRAEIEALAPSAASYSDADLLRYIQIVDAEGIVRLGRLIEQADLLSAAGIALDSPEAFDLAALATLDVGTTSADSAQVARVAASTALQASEIAEMMAAAGVLNGAALSEQIQIVRSLYSGGLLTNPDVAQALQQELDSALAANTVIRRPGNRLLTASGTDLAGAIYGVNASGASVLQQVYLKLGGSALVFFPENLEAMLVRSIPFIIAGLAVALGFKAGLFNIGAEGQLYAGAILSVWVGFSPIFSDLPIFIHLPLMLLVGVFGGFLWGAIPGVLKAYTGAHEVIVTIMLNYIAIRMVDWLIKSTNPVILLDTTASTPRTPFIDMEARLPRFTEFSPWIMILAGIVVAAFIAWNSREAIAKHTRALLRPIILGLAVALVGLFLQVINVRGTLHIGLVIMVLTVWLTDWFLQRTTLGFELRTVGANSSAARYAGMSVPRNIVLALALAGALGGLAGTIEVSGVQYNMQPAFFSGVGFDAIAVALLARSNPRNMPIAGFLWGALLSGAGLMQVRADISIDLVKIIQALIIMFIAADAIIRYLWRVPEAEEQVTNVFAKGWGG